MSISCHCVDWIYFYFWLLSKYSHWFDWCFSSSHLYYGWRQILISATARRSAMLPRRSLVVKYAFCTAVVTTVLLLWISSPDGGYTENNLSPWRRIVQGIEMIGLNETRLRIEFEELKNQVRLEYNDRKVKVTARLRDRLNWTSTSALWWHQRYCSDWKQIGVAPFLSSFIVFSRSSIASVNTALTLTLSVKGKVSENWLIYITKRVILTVRVNEA